MPVSRNVRLSSWWQPRQVAASTYSALETTSAGGDSNCSGVPPDRFHTSSPVATSAPMASPVMAIRGLLGTSRRGIGG